MTRFTLPHLYRGLLLLCSLGTFSVAMTAQVSVHAMLPDGREIRPAGNWIATFPFPSALR
jgi:hypothetical protein